MKIYRLEWSWYDDGMTLLFSSEEDKSEEQFFVDCSEAFQKTGGKLLETKHYPDMPTWVELAGIEICSMGYKVYNPISLSIHGDFLIIGGKSIVDVDLFPVQKLSTEEFLGIENCEKIKEKMIKCEIEHNERMKENYEKLGDFKEDGGFTDED